MSRQKQVLTAGIVNQGFNGNERAAGRKGIVSRADEMHLFFEIPVMQDHAHRDDVGFGQWIFEEITGSGTDAIAESGGCDVPLCDRLYGWQIKGGAAKMRMFLCDFNTEQAGRSADITKGFKV
jgi:hypothetical protein